MRKCFVSSSHLPFFHQKTRKRAVLIDRLWLAHYIFAYPSTNTFNTLDSIAIMPKNTKMCLFGLCPRSKRRADRCPLYRVLVGLHFLRLRIIFLIEIS